MDTVLPNPRLNGSPSTSAPSLPHLSACPLPNPSDEEDAPTAPPPSFSLRILLYPIVYTSLVLPLSIARWSSGFGASAASDPIAARTTFIAGSIYYLNGFANAFLLLYVRKSISLLSPPPPEVEEEAGKVGRWTLGLKWGRKDRDAEDVNGSYHIEGGLPLGESRRQGREKRPIGGLRIPDVEVSGDISLPD